MKRYGEKEGTGIDKERIPSCRYYEQKRGKFRVRGLAEAIILQAIEDLWNPVYRKESLLFFRGEGFYECAKSAGITLKDQLRILQLLSGTQKGRDKRCGVRRLM